MVTDGKKTVHLLPSCLRIILVLAHPYHHPGKEVRGHPAEATGGWGGERQTMKLGVTPLKPLVVVVGGGGGRQTMKLGVTPLKPLAGGGETDYEVKGHPAEATSRWGRDRL